jgi:hypothetical protein
MKRLLPRMSVLALGLALLVCAVSASGDEILLPLEAKIRAGETTIDYAGQSFRFTTSVPLYARFEWMSASHIQYKVRVQAGYAIPSAPAGTIENTVEIYWSNADKDIYSGGVPTGTLEGILNTEGGFVDR